jgi:hypothetical protein
MHQRKKPKSAYNPPKNKIPVTVEDVHALENMQFKWRATPQYVDYDEEEWGWGNVAMERFFNKCLKHLQHYENMTWAQIKEADNCHPVPLGDIVAKAQRRIVSKHGDMDDLWQVKAEGRCRLFGHKDRQIFYLIWHDKYHTVYPKGK